MSSTNINDRFLEILKELTDNQKQIKSSYAHLETSMEKIVTNFEHISEKLEDTNKVIRETNDVIFQSNVVISGVKDAIKEFSIYASNREKADQHLTDSMDLLAEMWQGSINLFSETREIIDSIHAYAELITNERTRILSNIASEKYKIIGASMLEEWLFDLLIVIIEKMAPHPMTEETIKSWLMMYMAKFIQENGYTAFPKFQTAEIRLVLSEKVHDDIYKEFKMTPFFSMVYWVVLMIYESIINGERFTNYPKLMEVLESMKNLEGELYE